MKDKAWSCVRMLQHTDPAPRIAGLKANFDSCVRAVWLFSFRWHVIPRLTPPPNSTPLSLASAFSEPDSPPAPDPQVSATQC
eukprot:6172365-Pleurochrysis_carterae.AAC.3